MRKNIFLMVLAFFFVVGCFGTKPVVKVTTRNEPIVFAKFVLGSTRSDAEAVITKYYGWRQRENTGGEAQNITLTSDYERIILIFKDDKIRLIAQHQRGGQYEYQEFIEKHRKKFGTEDATDQGETLLVKTWYFNNKKLMLMITLHVTGTIIKSYSIEE